MIPIESHISFASQIGMLIAHYARCVRWRACVMSYVLSLALLFPMLGHADLLEEVRGRGLLRIGVTVWDPWVIERAPGELIGFEVDVARMLAQDMGVKAEFVPYEWNELIDQLNSGEIDIIIAGMAITPERALRVNFSQPYYVAGASIALNRQCTAEMERFSDLNRADVMIGAVRDTVAHKTVLSEKFPDATRRVYDTPEQAQAALLAGEIHAYLDSEPLPKLLELQCPDLIVAPLRRPIRRTGIGFALRKGDPDFLNFVNAWITYRRQDDWLAARKRFWFESTSWSERPLVSCPSRRAPPACLQGP
jgi:polar amino acid transport system substrate-binding protein